MYDHVLKTMMIFNVFIDCDVNMMLELNWNISPENIDVVFHIVNDKCYEMVRANDEFSKHLEIVTFMKYLGVQQDIMKETINRMMSPRIINYINKCKSIAYDDNMMFIFDNYDWSDFRMLTGHNGKRIEFKIFIDNIITTHFPIKFQKKIIKQIILSRIPHEPTISSIMILSRIGVYCNIFECINDKKMIIDKMDEHIQKIKNDKNYVMNNWNEIFETFANHIIESLISRNKIDT